MSCQNLTDDVAMNTDFAENSRMLFVKHTLLYELFKKRAEKKPSFLQRDLRYMIQAKQSKRIQITVSLSGSSNAAVQAQNIFPVYALIAKPISTILYEGHSPVYQFTQACLLTCFDESGRNSHTEATFIIQDLKTLANIILVSCGQFGQSPDENNCSKNQLESPSLRKLGGQCFWGKIPNHLLHSSLENCVDLSLGRTKKFALSVTMSPGFGETKFVEQDSFLTFCSLKSNAVCPFQLEVSIRAQTTGARYMFKSPYYNSYLYNDVPPYLPHILSMRNGNVRFKYGNDIFDATEGRPILSTPVRKLTVVCKPVDKLLPKPVTQKRRRQAPLPGSLPRRSRRVAGAKPCSPAPVTTEAQKRVLRHLGFGDQEVMNPSAQDSYSRPILSTPVRKLTVVCKPVDKLLPKPVTQKRRRQAPLPGSLLRRSRRVAGAKPCSPAPVTTEAQKRVLRHLGFGDQEVMNPSAQDSYITEGFCCSFCYVKCGSFKGLEHHLMSSHDRFNFHFWISEKEQGVNVSLKHNTWRDEDFPAGIDPRQRTFSYFSSKYRKRRSLVTATEVNTPSKDTEMIVPSKVTETIVPSKATKTIVLSKATDTIRHEALLGVGSKSPKDAHASFEDSYVQNEIGNSLSDTSVDPAYSLHDGHMSPPRVIQFGMSRRLSVDQFDPKIRQVLRTRQFFHSHKGQQMTFEEVLSNHDSEDEIDDDVADLEDRMMLDSFDDIAKDEKRIMHMWNSFVSRQRVIADNHIPYACKAFCQLHGQLLARSPSLLGCWRLFMIKLWNHNLLNGKTMNTCSLIIDGFKNKGSDPK